MLLKWQNIEFKFSLVLATVIILSIIELGIHINTTQKLKQSTQALQNSQTSIENLLEADRDAYQTNLAVVLSIYRHLKLDSLNHDSLQLAAYENLQQIEVRFKKFNLHYAYSRKQSILELNRIYHEKFYNIKSITDSIFYFLKTENSLLALSKYRNNYLTQFNPMREVFNQLTDIHNSESELAFKEIENLNKKITIRTYSVYLLIILVFVAVSFLSLKSIKRRSREIEHLTSMLSKNNKELQNTNHSLEYSNEELRTTNEELNTLNENLDEQKNILENALLQLKETQLQLIQSEKNAALGIMVAGLAHELNNPINFVTSSTSALEKYNKNIFNILNEYRHCQSLEDLNKVRQLETEIYLDESIAKLNTLHSGLVDGAKRTSDLVKKMNLHYLGIETELSADINRLIEFCLKNITHKLNHRITIVKDLRNIPKVQYNISQLNQAITNLLNNAIEAITDKGIISISTGSNDEDIYIIISDNGCGISENIKDKIFDPFFTTKPVGKGLGLGLYTAYDIVRRYQGKILVDSELNKGSTLTIFLPIKSDTSNSPKIL